MQVTRSDFADISYFLAIERHRNFRLAGLELGLSASALSHALKGLEGRLGVRLLNRTNRSVTLTAAGETFKEAISGPFDAIGQAVEALNAFRDAPTGRVRLNVIIDAAQLLLAPVLSTFEDRYPGIQLDIVASDRMVDIIAEGFDAGIRHGGTVPEDMVTQRLSADLEWGVVAAPSYLERFGIPESPADLVNHRCISFRLGDDRPYRWEFDAGEGDFAVTVPDTLAVNDGRAMLAFAFAGVGLMYGNRAIFEPHVQRGDLKYVLTEWMSRGPAYQVYYSSRRQVPTGLRLLVDLIREMRPLGL